MTATSRCETQKIYKSTWISTSENREIWLIQGEVCFNEDFVFYPLHRPFRASVETQIGRVNVSCAILDDRKWAVSFHYGTEPEEGLISQHTGLTSEQMFWLISDFRQVPADLCSFPEEKDISHSFAIIQHNISGQVWMLRDVFNEQMRRRILAWAIFQEDLNADAGVILLSSNSKRWIAVVQDYEHFPVYMMFSTQYSPIDNSFHPANVSFSDTKPKLGRIFWRINQGVGAVA